MKSTVGVGVSCFFQCSDTIGWGFGQQKYEKYVPLISKFSLPEQVGEKIEGDVVI